VRNINTKNAENYLGARRSECAQFGTQLTIYVPVNSDPSLALGAPAVRGTPLYGLLAPKDLIFERFWSEKGID